MGRGFVVHIPVRLLRDRALSPEARFLYVQLKAYADGASGRTYVRGETLEKDLRWGRRKRERAQGELCKTGWLRLERKSAARGRFGRRIYVVCDPLSTIAHSEHSGEIEQLIS